MPFIMSRLAVEWRRSWNRIGPTTGFTQSFRPSFGQRRCAWSCARLDRHDRARGRSPCAGRDVPPEASAYEPLAALHTAKSFRTCHAVAKEP